MCAKEKKWYHNTQRQYFGLPQSMEQKFYNKVTKGISSLLTIGTTSGVVLNKVVLDKYSLRITKEGSS